MRPIHALVVLPVAFVLVMPFFINQVTPFVLGMPLLLGWLAGTLVVTSIVMALIYLSDRRHRLAAGQVEGDAA
jgi:Protein of unknown function (DUF3311)